MSIVDGNRKANMLATVLLPDEMSFAEQCETERAITLAIASVLNEFEKEGKVKRFMILDDSLIDETLLANAEKKI